MWRHVLGMPRSPISHVTWCADSGEPVTAALGVHDPLWDALAVELRHLLEQVMVLQQDRPVAASGQRVLVTLNRDTRVVVVAGPFGCFSPLVVSLM